MFRKIINLLKGNKAKLHRYAPYSYSKINIWERCPYKFKLQYIDNIKIPFTKNFAMIRGSYLHHCIEHHSSGKDFKTTKIFDEENKEESLKNLEIFRNSEIGKYYLSQNGNNEISFAIEKSSESYKVCSYNSINAIFKGKIDYSFIKDNELYLIDWKSGKYNEEQNYEQLKLYSIWAFMKYKDIKTIHCSYVYIDHLKENKLIINRDELEYNTQYLDSFINKIENDNLFKRNEISLCEYCDFRKFNHCNIKGGE